MGKQAVPFKLEYNSKPCHQMTEQEMSDCASLFSKNYGIWGKGAGARAGRPIRLSAAQFASRYCSREGCYAAMMFDGGRLIGQVIYFRRPCPWKPSKRVTFILQLVIDKAVRGHGLGLSLLQSILGFSDDEAWGLFSSNPLTIHALEEATFRRVEVARTAGRLAALRPILNDALDDGGKWIDTFHDGMVDTGFPADHSQIDAKIRRAYSNGDFPFPHELGDSEEWLAVIFHGQKMRFNAEAFDRLTKTSKTVLENAFSRMDVMHQTWTTGTAAEVKYLFSNEFIKVGDSVLDLGCGTGRHALALANSGCHVVGVDFSERLVGAAIEESGRQGIACESVTFKVADARTYRTLTKFDAVICLYDVIGASQSVADNEKIVATIWNALKPGGIAVVSAMNSQLLCEVCRKEANRFSDIGKIEDFIKLAKLPPSETMRKTGEVFKAGFLLFNPKTGEVYHKEQFVGDNLLPVEYVIAERRYDADSLERLFKGFRRLDVSYVSAGHFDKRLNPTERHAKEVLGVFQRPKFWWD